MEPKTGARMGNRTTTRTSDPAQKRLPYAAAEAHLRESIALLRRLAEKLGLAIRAREFLIRIALVEHDNGNPLRKTYTELGDHERGMGCSERTAFRIVEQLEELSLISVERIVTGSGQRPNEYRIDWEGVRALLFPEQAVIETLEIVEPGCHSTPPRLSNCQTPVAILSEPGCQNVNHKRNNSFSSLPNTLPSSSTTCAGEATAAVLDGEEDSMRANRDEWISEAHRKKVRLAELAVDKAIADGRDVPRLLRLFNAVMVGWEGGKRGKILYDLLTKSPRSLTKDEDLLAPYPFDFPSAVEVSRERVRRLEKNSSPQRHEGTKEEPKPMREESPEVKAQMRVRIQEAMAKLKGQMQ